MHLSRYILGASLLGVSLLGAKPASAQTLIDNFDGVQQTVSTNPVFGPTTLGPTATDGNHLGFRTVNASRVSGTGRVDGYFNVDPDDGTPSGIWEMSATSQAIGRNTATYAGFGSIDLTANGVHSFKLVGSSDNVGARLRVTVFTGGNSSFGEANIVGGAFQSYLISLASLSGTATLTNVDKIELRLTGNDIATDARIDLFETTNAPEPASALMLLPGLLGAVALKRRRAARK